MAEEGVGMREGARGRCFGRLRLAEGEWGRRSGCARPVAAVRDSHPPPNLPPGRGEG